MEAFLAGDKYTHSHHYTPVRSVALSINSSRSASAASSNLPPVLPSRSSVAEFLILDHTVDDAKIDWRVSLDPVPTMALASTLKVIRHSATPLQSQYCDIGDPSSRCCLHAAVCVIHRLPMILSLPHHLMKTSCSTSTPKKSTSAHFALLFCPGWFILAAATFWVPSP